MKRTLEELWPEISPLLDEALELPAGEREPWLAALGARAPELAEHVKACLLKVSELTEQKFLETPVRLQLPAGLEGHTFGAYTLDRPLGFGGMGTVWLAHRSDGRFEGQVAVKLLNPAFVGHPSEQRFAREGSVLARLQHPNIARLLDAGVEGGRQPYLVLEYVQGERIDEYCEERHLDVEQRIRLFLDVLAAVAHAHSNLVVHRDLKPANILVTEAGEVKLLDFGVAALLSHDHDVAGLTGHIGPGLTPGYASPEQLLGQPITTATDVYALGTVLFQLLAGRHPLFARDQPKTAAELNQLTLDADAPCLSDVSATPERRRSFKGDLDNIIATALRRNAGERYRTAELFAQDLRHYLAHEPVSAQPRSFRYLASKFIRRNWAAVFTTFAVASALIVAGAFSVWQMIEANQQRRLAEDQASRAELARDFAEFVLTDAGTTGRPFTTSELLLRAEQTIESQYGSVDSPAAVEQVIELGKLFARLGQNRKALPLFEKAHARAIAGNFTELRWQSACELGRLNAYAGRLQQSKVLLTTAINELQKNVPDSAALIECLEEKSDLDLTLQDAASAITAARSAVAQAERLFPRVKLRHISPRIQLGTAYRSAGELQAADRLHQGTLALLQELGRERSANAVLLYISWAAVKGDAGDIMGSVELVESALSIGRALWPDAEPEQWASVNYGRRLLPLNRFDEAEEYMSRAVRLASAEEEAETEAASLLGLIAVKRDRGDLEGARAMRERAEQFIRAHLPPEHALRVQLVFESGLLDVATGSFDAAKAQLQQVLSQYTRAGVHATYRIAALGGLAQCELATGHLDAAGRFAADGTALARKLALPGQPSYWVGTALLVQADVEQAQSRAGRARELSAEALSQLTPTVGADHPLTKKAAALAKS